MDVTLRDAVAVRWLWAFSDKWHGGDPPRHVAPLQEEIDKYRQGYEIERIVEIFLRDGVSSHPLLLLSSFFSVSSSKTFMCANTPRPLSLTATPRAGTPVLAHRSL